MWDSRISKKPHECAGYTMLPLLLLVSRAFWNCNLWIHVFRMRGIKEWKWEEMAERELHPFPEFFPHPVPEEHLVHPELISLSQRPHAFQRPQNHIPEAYAGHSSCTTEIHPGIDLGKWLHTSFPLWMRKSWVTCSLRFKALILSVFGNYIYFEYLEKWAWSYF